MNNSSHASKDSDIFQPQFGQKYVVQIVSIEKNEDKIVEIIKKMLLVEKLS